MSENNLYRTRTYLVGNMEYVSDSAGQSWRDYITEYLNKWGVIVFNPYQKPFIKDVQESAEAKALLEHAAATEDFDTLAMKMREIRIFDLNLVDRSDFIIANINPKVASWGSAEEMVTAVRMKKPIFLSIEGGKAKCPKWIFGMIPHKYIYNNVQEIVQMLEKINTGEKTIDSDRWRLLRKEYR